MTRSTILVLVLLAACSPPPPSTCAPTTCADAKADCGTIPDGCGGELKCPVCATGLNCGGAGPNRCGTGTCTPATCSSLGKNCGTVSDGCGAILSCGSCSGADTCGGGGVANVCGSGCTPGTCASLGKNCGTLSDGCGGSISCGTCGGGATCGGAGTANVCGVGCTPTTCAAQGKNCGALSDGCGAMLSCGTCSGNLSCGGAGSPNVCGATCAVTCPQGYSCDNSGVCVGGVPTNLVFDVKTVPVSGSITLNGATPQNVGTDCANYPNDVKATVTFSDASKGYTVSANVLCSSSTFAFSTSLFPGTYSVVVRGTSYSNVPIANYLAATQLPVTVAISNKVFDVQTLPMSGTITLNGATPQNVGTDCANYPNDVKATVTFTDAAKGYAVTANVLCSSSTFAFSTGLFPGTYVVVVRGTSYSNLPVANYQAIAQLPMTAAIAGQVLDVKTFAVSGSITLNGATPQNVGTDCANYPNDVKATVNFVDASKGYSVTADVLCSSSTFAYSTALFPGTYVVTVRGTAYSNVPVGNYQAIAQLPVTAAISGQVLDVKTFAVSGSITLNGATPQNVGTDCANYPNDVKATVTFTDASKGYAVTANVLCSSSTFAYSTGLYPGTYRVLVRGTSYSSVPVANYEAIAQLPVTAAISGQVLDVKTLAVSGSITLNGAVPQNVGTDCANYPNDIKSTVTFTDGSKGYSVRADVLCSSSTFSFATALFPGTYRVQVKGTSYANVPVGDYEVIAQLPVTTALSGQVYDVKTVSVSGKVTLNGGVPMNVGTDCANYPNDVKATVSFVDASRGYFIGANILCSSVDFSFTTLVFPGSYEVRVKGTSYSNIPIASYLVVGNLAIP